MQSSIIIGIIIFHLLWLGSFSALAQNTSSGDANPPASSSPPSAAAEKQDPKAQPSAPETEEEYIEVERKTMFGIERVRVPKSQTASRPAPPTTQAPQAVAPPAPAQIPPNVPAAVQQQPSAPPQSSTPSPPAAQPQPSAASPAAPAQVPDTAPVPIALHLENADLTQVVGIIASELKMNYVIDPQVKGTVNINTMGEVRRADLFPLLQMILRINGATAVQTGNFFRIVPLKDVQRMPIDPLFNPPPANLPPDDRMVMNIIPLKYVSAPDMTKILTPFLSEGGHLFSHDAGNILLITDTSRSMKRLLDLMAMFDTDAFTNQRARLLQIKNSQAAKVAEDLKEIFSAYALSGAPAVRFMPIDRINSILVVTANPGIYAEVEKWLEKLDQPLQESGVRNFIYKVENAKAEDLATVVAQLLGLTTPTAARAPGVTRAGQATGGLAGPATSPLGPAPTTAAAASSAEPSASPTSHIRIVPDTINNQLVIQATSQEYEQIRQTLKELDVIPRQVMIEAKVYEVDLTGDLSVGVTAFLQNRDNAERKPLGSFGPPQGGGPSALNVSVGTLVGRTRQLLLFLNAAENRTRARVISAPSILASDNLAASINVGTQIPVLTSQALVAGAQVGGTSLFTNTIQNLDTGVMLTITPRINPSGLVNLQINQEVSAPLAPTGAIQSPSIQKRQLTTQIVVEDGQTIALGGIIQENHSHSRNRVPLLGDIPYLGVLFGSTSISSQRTELIILITPTVIRSISEAQVATNELRDKLRDLRGILEEEEKRQKEQKERRQKEKVKE